MADFYSAFSCNSCCAAANTDKLSIVLCCENKQPCCNMGRSRRRGRGSGKDKKDKGDHSRGGHDRGGRDRGGRDCNCGCRG